MAVETVPGAALSPGAAASAQIKKSIGRRYSAERRFRMYGVAAILFGLAFLVVLFGSIVRIGYTAFVQTSFHINVPLEASVIDPSGKFERNTLMLADYALLARRGLAA